MSDLSLDNVFWQDRNETQETVVLYGSNGTPFSFPPGSVFVPPKQVEALNAIRTHKATLLDGGMGGGKSVAAAMCINDFFFELSTPGHTHGLDPTICNIAHERLYAFLIGQTLADIRRRNLPHWLERYGEFGNLNKQEWEFTYHDAYGSHVVVMIGSDDPKKLRGTMAAIAFHDECTLDMNFRERFSMTLKRLRQAGIPHTPWVGATNTTGPSRAEVRDIFIDKPRPAVRDPKTKKLFPGYTHIHSTIYDNPYMDRAVIYEMEQGTEFEVQAYVKGSWDHPEGAMFRLENGIHIVDDADYDIDETWPMCIGMDFGWDHPTVCGADVRNPETGQIVHNLVWSESQKTAMKAKLEIYEYFADSKFPIERATVRVGDIAGKRGEAKLSASKLQNSTDWHIFNSVTKHGNLTLPSFRLKPAWKGRVEGWKAVRDEFDYDFDWIARNPEIPMSETNRKPFVTRAPNTVILRSCWQTISSYTNLQKHEDRQDDHQETSGIYGPGKGDDEAVTHRYRNMAFRKRKFGGQSKRVPEMAGERHVTTQRRGRFGRELRAYQLAGGGTSGYAG